MSGVGGTVESVKVSPKFQVVIPKLIRENLRLQPGQILEIFILDGSIHLQPPRSVKELRGLAKGIKWKEDYRDYSDRF